MGIALTPFGSSSGGAIGASSASVAALETSVAELEARVGAAEATLESDDTTLDTIKELVDFVKANRTELQTLADSGVLTADKVAALEQRLAAAEAKIDINYEALTKRINEQKLSDLANVSQNAAAVGDVLRFNGVAWEPSPDSGAGSGSSSAADAADAEPEATNKSYDELLADAGLEPRPTNPDWAGMDYIYESPYLEQA